MSQASWLRVATVFGAIVVSACGGGGGSEEASALPPEPPEPGPSAELVIGQATFTDNQANRGGAIRAGSMKAPIGNVAISEGGTLFISDSRNGRILAYTNVPTSNGASANFAVGKPDPDSADPGPISGNNLGTPVSVSVADGRMAVTDASGHRVLIYDTVPSANGAAARFVVGQGSLTDTMAGGCTDNGLNRPRSSVLTPNGKLVVADTLNHRVLIWNTVPATDGQAADVVLGQADFTHCSRNDDNQDRSSDLAPTARTLNEPIAVWSDGQRLVVADAENNRVLIWNSIPLNSTQNFKPADLVLGQTSFTGGGANGSVTDGVSNAPSAMTMSWPGAVHSDGVRLAVADTANQRILIWNRIPTQSATVPDRVVGHGDFTRGTPNDTNLDGTEDGSPSAAVLKTPRGVLLHGANLFVSDTDNNRVLIFGLAP